MSQTTQISKSDVMFVAGETDRLYQHVAAIMVLDPGDEAEFNFQSFREHCIERVSQVPHFHWRLHSVPLGLDRPYWVEDENFSYDHHIKRIALPTPGDKEVLCEIASHLYCRHLDRNRPLWEIWLIEGLEGGKYAYLQKFHHCMMDGEGAYKMIETICDFEPRPTQPKLINEAIREAKAGRVPSYAESTGTAWRHFSRLPGEATRSIVDILRPKIAEQLQWPRKPAVERPPVPEVSFNGPISSDRAMTYAVLPMDRIKAVKSHFKVSINDVVLALVGSAVRAYLLQHSELPELALRSNIPVSIRTGDDDQFSNRVTNVTVTLATDIDDPVARLQAIHLESEQAKANARSGSAGMVEMFQMMPPWLVGTVMGSLPDDQGPQMLGANLVVSNVRGSPIPLYIAGAHVENMCPMSILTAGMGINVTCISYDKGMDFGIMAEPVLVPHLEDIALELEAALEYYHELCNVKRKRKNSGSRAPKTRAKGHAKGNTAKRAR